MPPIRTARVATAVLSSVGVALIGTAVLAPGSASASREGAAHRPKASNERTMARTRTADALAHQVEAQAGLIATPKSGGGLAVYNAPGDIGPSQVFPALDELGSPLTLLTVGRQAGWFEVLLPTRPNGSTAWVPEDSVTVATPTVRVEVSLAAKQLQLIRVSDGAVLLTSAIGDGAPDRPTPTGKFFVRDLFPTTGANHPYGPFAFGLSGHSDVLTRFGTGDGRIAIHGTNDPSTIGADASNGCVHVPNDVDTQLIPYLTLGTPVTIS